MAAETSIRPRAPRRSRLRILLGLLGVSVAAHLITQYYPLVPPDDLSPSGRGLVDSVKALDGRARVLGRSRGFLRHFWASERFGVDFFGHPIDDESFGRFMERHGHLVLELDLRHTPISDDGLRHLIHARRLRRLILGNIHFAISHRVQIPTSPITDAGLVHLAHLEHLRSLHLDGLPITDAGLAALENLPALRGLSLSRTRVNGPGLGRLRSLSGLRCLNLAHCAIGEHGLGHLAGASSLQYLKLLGVPLTREGLTPLKALPRLTRLNLGRSDLPDREVEDLRESRPTLKITWN
jgi:hypothetical protein